MKLISMISMILSLVVANEDNSTGPAHGPIDWEQHEYDSEAYFKDIPDLVNMTNVKFKF
jgi:hypothetical protein